ncbi:mads-box transcription factor 30 [Phtheirospermum japonicum]|uniref:Mads-box transcription factor 30 n=1 Tax=Phtheirospermum japonicum TaxID=374723 RepID=A0A830CPL9_9LAMI|nr:mads-box transcription factor 30 [Phtheirospermum japonicum]
MGRKIDMKKIEDITRCQVTFSKRRSSVMKKANEVAVCCDVDVVFVAFSPSGRISKFCNQKRIEDVLHRYVDLPAEMRLNFPILDSQDIFEPETTLTPHAQTPSSHNPIGVFSFSDATHKSSQSSCNIPGPRFTSTTTITTNASRVEYDEIGTGLRRSNLNSNRLSNMGYCKNSFNNIGKTRVESVDDEQSRAPFDQQKEVFQDTKYDNFLPEDTLEDDTISTSEVQTSGLWEWDDLLLDGNINLQEIFSEQSSPDFEITK